MQLVKIMPMYQVTPESHAWDAAGGQDHGKPGTGQQVGTAAASVCLHVLPGNGFGNGKR